MKPKQKKQSKKPRFVSIVYVRYLILERVELLEEECKRVISLLKQGCKFDDNGTKDFSRAISNTEAMIREKSNAISNLLYTLSSIENEASQKFRGACRIEC